MNAECEKLWVPYVAHKHLLPKDNDLVQSDLMETTDSLVKPADFLCEAQYCHRVSLCWDCQVYAMSGTHIPALYAMSGTEIAYGARLRCSKSRRDTGKLK
eukprot:3834793-Rhodomonas_salina.2